MGDIVLKVSRSEEETWREAAARSGAEYGLEEEVLFYYDKFRTEGDEPSTACWRACYEWDVCVLEVDGVDVEVHRG